MRKHFLPLMVGLFVTLGITQAFANEEEQGGLPIPKNIIDEKVYSFLSSASLHPYISPGYFMWRITNYVPPIIDDEQKSAVFVAIEVKTDQKPLKGMFVVYHEKATNNVTASLLFLSDSDLISPTLFFDIVYSPQFYLSCPEAVTLLREKRGHIFISSDDSNFEEKRAQTWTIFSADENYSIYINLMDDGKGRTYFTISMGKK